MGRRTGFGAPPLARAGLCGWYEPEQVGDAASTGSVELCQGVFPDGEEEAAGETFAANGLRELFEK